MNRTAWFLWIVPLFVVPIPMTNALGDEGMWLVNEPPRSLLKARYQFDLTDAWLKRAQLASVRFNNGGSGGFVSADGLIVSNHHIGADSLQKLSPKDKDYLRDGYYARTRAEELKCPDLELNVLQSIEDVTAAVTKVVKPEMTPSQAFAARRGIMARIEKESLDKTSLRSDVVTLYQGGRFHLYRYKKYTEVRLVMAPEQGIAFFGGDVDNFEYPRFNLDICFFRAYEGASRPNPGTSSSGARPDRPPTNSSSSPAIPAPPTGWKPWPSWSTAVISPCLTPWAGCGRWKRCWHVPFHTTFAGAFERAERQGHRDPFILPERWLKHQSKLDPATPFNFVSTADTISGNSGSPILNRAGELVGINFDRNRHGLVRNFVYTDAQARQHRRPFTWRAGSVAEALRCRTPGPRTDGRMTMSRVYCVVDERRSVSATCGSAPRRAYASTLASPDADSTKQSYMSLARSLGLTPGLKPPVLNGSGL